MSLTKQRVLFFVLLAVVCFSVPWAMFLVWDSSFNSPYTGEAGLVQIIGPFWYGSGFIASKNGIVVTAAHVLDGIGEATVLLNSGREIYLDPNTFLIDQTWDIAIARLEDYSGAYYTLGVQSDIKLGTPVKLLGFPLGVANWHSFGHVARPNYAGLIDIDCGVYSGNSGGPIMINDRVVGIITRGYAYTNINSGINVSVIRNMIERYKILKGQ